LSIKNKIKIKEKKGHERRTSHKNTSPRRAKAHRNNKLKYKLGESNIGKKGSRQEGRGKNKYKEMVGNEAS
jgi:hypothetical protein